MNVILYPILNQKAIRCFLIHDLLKTGKKFTAEEIMKYIREHDRTSSYYSLRTFREDIRFLKDELDAPLKPSNRGEYFYYTEFDVYAWFGIKG